MYPAAFNYHRPETVQQAIALLDKFGTDAKVIAGGQTLIPMMKMRMGDMAELIDIGRLSDLDYIRKEGDTFHIGALATHAEVAGSEVGDLIPLIRDCVGGIADKQVRNRGTIGGGLSVADPSGDWPTGLHVLDATVVCTGPNGSRNVPIKDFIVESYTTALADNELVTEVQIKIPRGGNAGGAYIAFKRAAPAYPTCTAAVQLSMNGETCEDIKIALGAAGTRAVMSSEAENMLKGQPLTTENLRKAAEVIVAASNPPPDARGSEKFKRAMLRKLVVETSERALARSRGEQVKGGHKYA
jgi:carbon-monoxide dehydrogenase medium subunit